MSFIMALFWLMVSGAFFAVVFAGGNWRKRVIELVSLSFFLGAGYVSFQFLTLYLFGGQFDFLNIIAIPGFMFLLLAALCVWGRTRSDSITPAVSNSLNMVQKFLLAGILIQFAWVLFSTLPMPVHSHDVVANYAFKAKIFDMAKGIPTGFFTWTEAAVAHPDYPPLLPLLMTWIYAFTGFIYFKVNLVMPVVYLAFLLLFYALVRKRFNRTQSLLVTFILATIPQVADYATIMYADLMLAALVTCGFIYAMQYIREREKASLFLASALFAISLWVKNEAMVFTGCFWVVLLVLLARTERIDRRNVAGELIGAFFLMAIIAAPWFVVKLSAAANSDLDLARLTFKQVIENVKDIPVFLNLFQQEVFGPKKWNIFWVLFFAALVWKRKLLWKNENSYMTIFLLLAFLGYFSAYMVMTGENLFFYVNTTISRFMIHFCGISLFMMASLVFNKEV
ncbi:MAG: glycosyltransferase family 39 protein [Candidatus Omnitrophota bacterium]